MPRNGSGVYTPPLNSWNPAIDGALATPGDWNSMRDDIASAISQSVSSDGQTEMTGQLNMGGNRITQIGAPIGQGQALRWEQLIKGADIPSASSLPIPVEGALFNVTGTTTINSIPDVYPGRLVYLRFTGVLTITNSASLVMPRGASFTTRAGDILVFVNESPGIWVCVSLPSRVSALSAFRNKLINAQGVLNQRTYLSGTATTTANQYTRDRWKVIVSGQSASFTEVGISNTFSAPAGGLEQPIEGLNIEGGTYFLTWTGTATATVNGSAISNGGSVVLSAGTQANVRFINGTFREPQFELGTVTPFEYLPLEVTELRAQRYFENSQGNMSFTQPGNSGTVPQRTTVPYRVQKRVSPSVVVTLGVGSTSFISGNNRFVTFGFGGTTMQENSFSWTASAEI